MKKYRAFIGLPVSGETFSQLKQAVQENSAIKDLQEHWVAPENAHVTIRFLGDVFAADLFEMWSNIKKIVLQKINSLDLSVQHIAPFPPGRPKLFAALVDDNATLEDLYHQVNRVTQAFSGMKQKHTAFLPHITLMRNCGTPPTSIILKEPLTFLTNQLVLYQSVMCGNRRMYKCMDALCLS